MNVPGFVNVHVIRSVPPGLTLSASGLLSGTPTAPFGVNLTIETTDFSGCKGTRTYKTGDGLLEAMNWPHNGMNKGTVPVRILAVYAGVTSVANAQAVAHPD